MTVWSLPEKESHISYTFERVERERDSRGQIKWEKTKVFEAYPAYGRRHVLIQLSEDGTPRSPEQIERERRRAGRDLVEAEERAARAQSRQIPANQPPNETFFSFGISGR